MNINQKLNKIISIFFILLSFVSTSLLCVLSLIFTSYLNLETHEQQMVIYNGKVLSTILGIVVFLTINFLFAHLAGKMSDKRHKTFLILFAVYTFLVSFIWVVIAKSLPNSDSYSVYQLAVEFAQGNYRAIVPRDSYLACYPHQIGLIGFYQLVYEVIPLYDFRVLQCLNVPLITLFVISIYQITTGLCSSKTVKSSCIFLLLTCLPLYIYATNVYGDIPSIAFISFSIWMLISYTSKHHTYHLVLSVLALFLSVLVRENSLIFVIAYAITWSLIILRDKKYLHFFILIPVIAVCFLIPKGTQCFYEQLAGSTVGDGIPGTAHIAMGLQEGNIAPGWYNGYNFDTFMANDYDAALTDSQSKASIRESLQNFASNPGYSFSFFSQKFITQWTEPTYHCLLAAHTAYGDRFSLINSLFQGTGEIVFLFLCNTYQTALYLVSAVFLFQLLTVKKKKASETGLSIHFSEEYLVFAIALIGGIMFHTFWEGKARYIMPYCFFLIPYASIGCAYLKSKIRFLFR